MILYWLYHIQVYNNQLFDNIVYLKNQIFLVLLYQVFHNLHKTHLLNDMFHSSNQILSQCLELIIYVLINDVFPTLALPNNITKIKIIINNKNQILPDK